MTVWTIRPLTDPSAFSDEAPIASPFSTDWTSATKLLERELDHLDAHDVTLELDVLPAQIRVDGSGLRAKQVPASGRIHLSFESRLGPIVYFTGRFARSYRGMSQAWMHNVYATAKVLEALRMMDRYGVDAGRQYSGFKAIGAGSGSAAVADPPMAREAAARVLGGRSGISWEIVYADLDGAAARAYRLAAREHHPDVGGDRGAWNSVIAAARAMGVAK